MKRRLRGWAYAAAGLAIIIVSAALFAPARVDEKDAATVAAQVQEDPLKQFILEQEQLRSMQIAQLDEIINSDRSSQELMDRAQEEKIGIITRMETETTVAGILHARGYTDAAVSCAGGYVTVMVRASQAEKTDIARITELVTGQTGITAENIKIIPIN